MNFIKRSMLIFSKLLNLKNINLYIMFVQLPCIQLHVIYSPLPPPKKKKILRSKLLTLYTLSKMLFAPVKPWITNIVDIIATYKIILILN